MKKIFLALILLMQFAAVAFGEHSKIIDNSQKGCLYMKVNTKIETIKTDAFTMDFFRFGNGNKTLVIIPGVSLQSVMNFADAITESYKLFANDFTIYVMDRRKNLPDSYSVYDMAEDTAKALKILKLNRACIFGASQGGMIAMKIAIEYPELVDSMILGSTAACVTTTQFNIIENWIQLAKAGNATELYLSFGEALYTKSVFEQSRNLLIEASKTVTNEELNRLIIMSEGLKGFDITKDLNKITCPVLVIGATNDRVLGGEASIQIMEYLKNKPNCELFMYDDYGHAAYDIAPDYRERMLKFFTEHKK